MINIPDFWQENVEASRLTSLKTGGLVRYLARPTSIQELRETLDLAKSAELPLKMLGGGSNLIFSDQGFPGVVVKYSDNQIEPVDPDERLDDAFTYLLEQPVESRYQADLEGNFLKLGYLLEPLETSREIFYLELGAGLSWGQAVTATLKRQLVGLHWFARIPCQVGGAVYNNIHAEKHFLSEFVVAVRGIEVETGNEQIWYAPELDFGYDRSRFHLTGDFITSVIFALKPVPDLKAEAALAQYIDWTRQKSLVQPAGANCGSVFKNLDAEEALTYGQVSAGWYIDQADLKGEQIGEMQVYPGHANFIINRGGGTQKDFLRLVELIQAKVWEKYQIFLQPEVECLTETGEKIQWSKPKS